MSKPGTYKAKIKDYGITEPKDASKKPRVLVQFEYEIPHDTLPEHKKITWFSSLVNNDDSLNEITIKELTETFGATPESINNLGNGIGSHAINEDRDYEIVLEEDTYQGKTSLKVKYVNIFGATRKSDKMDAAKASVFVGGLNLAGKIAALQAKNPPALDTKAHVPF